jgi:shikimate kinase
MKVFLVGYMGSGKSSIGPQLADVMGIPFIDLDKSFELKYKISIPLFFEKYGEKHFRTIERDLLVKLSSQDEFVMATGGGTPCHENNMALMNQRGTTIYLRLPLEILIKRLRKSPSKRPILTKFMEGNFEKEVTEHLKQREEFYMLSQLIIESPTPDPKKIASLILNQRLFHDEV